jgi:hypothetical protein
MVPLFRQVEKLGHSVKADRESSESAFVEINSQRVDFTLRERQRQVRTPLTEEEKRYSFNREQGWRQDLQPTGELLFEITDWVNEPIRKRWRAAAESATHVHGSMFGLLTAALGQVQQRLGLSRLTPCQSDPPTLLASAYCFIGEVTWSFIRPKTSGAQSPAEDPADDLSAIPQGPAVTRAGDLWLMGEHRVLCGNALNLGAYGRR